MHNKMLQNALLDAERLYNTLVEWYGDLDTSDDQIKRLDAVYKSTLAFLEREGVGGVLINGIFRIINNESKITFK